MNKVIETIIDHRGRTPAKLGSEFTSRGVPVASAQLVSDGRLNLREARHVNDDTWKRWMPIKTRRGDVLLTSEAPLGRVALVEDDSPLVLGQRLFALRVNPEIANARFFYYWLKSTVGQMRLAEQATGSTVVGIRQSALLRVRVDLPELVQQARVAEVLGAFDDKITANRNLATKARELAVGVAARVRQLCLLGEVSWVDKSIVRPELLLGASVDLYSLPAFDRGAPDRCLPNLIKSAKLEISADCVLVSKLNPHIPRIWWVDPSRSETRSVASTEFVPLLSNGISSACLWATVVVARVSQQLEEKVSGTSKSHQRVGLKDLESCEVVDLRTLSDERREAIDSMILRADDADRESSRLAAARDELLPLLMSGKITVRDAERRAEEVL